MIYISLLDADVFLLFGQTFLFFSQCGRLLFEVRDFEPQLTIPLLQLLFLLPELLRAQHNFLALRIQLVFSLLDQQILLVQLALYLVKFLDLVH